MAQPHTARSSIVPTTVEVATILIQAGRNGMLSRSVANMVSLSLADVLLLANVVVAVAMVSLLLSDVVADMFGSSVAVEVVLLSLVGVVATLVVVIV